jgi:molybdate transport system permease protein
MSEFDLSPLIVSIKTTLAATLVTFILGLVTAYWMAGYRGRFRGILDGLFILPLVLPPTVVGFLLLVLFGRNGPLGKLLQYFDKSIIFSWTATVIAAVVVSFPMMYRTAKGAFEQIDRNVINAARTLGVKESKVFTRVCVPLAWPGIVAGGMLAGNIPGKTQTIPLAIYFAVEGGEESKAYVWVALIIAISFLVIFIMNFWLGHQQKFISGRWEK